MAYDFYVQKRSVSQKRKDLLASRLRAGDVSTESLLGHALRTIPVGTGGGEGGRSGQRKELNSDKAVSKPSAKPPEALTLGEEALQKCPFTPHTDQLLDVGCFLPALPHRWTVTLGKEDHSNCSAG